MHYLGHVVDDMIIPPCQQIENERKENLASVSEGLWALSCGPVKQVKTSAACKINGMRYSTVDREKFLKTQNSVTEPPHYWAYLCQLSSQGP